MADSADRTTDTQAGTADPLAATLAGIRERAGVLAKLGPPRTSDSAVANAAFASAGDVPGLVKAVGAALGKAEDWEQEAARLDRLAMDDRDPQSRIAVSLRAQAFEDCARELREAITVALAGEETARGDGS